MGSTGDPSGEPSLAPCGPLTPSRKRGAGRKSAPATQPYIRPALSDLYHAQYRSLFRLAVLLTGVDGPRKRWCGTPLRRCIACGSARRRRTTRCRTCGDCWWPVTAGQASSLGRQQAAPGGGGAVWLHCARSSAARRLGCDPALRRLPTGQRERSCALSTWTSAPSRPPRPCG